MNDQRFAPDFSWAATFDLMHGLRPMIPDDDFQACFNVMYERVKSAIATALAARDLELQRLKPVKLRVSRQEIPGMKMKQRKIQQAAVTAAKMLVKMVAPALLPSERKEYLMQAIRVCRGLLESSQRQAGREKMRAMMANMN